MTTNPTCLWPAEWVKLLQRIQYVHDQEKLEAERAAAMVGEDAPVVLRMRWRVGELAEVVRKMREGA